MPLSIVEQSRIMPVSQTVSLYKNRGVGFIERRQRVLPLLGKRDRRMNSGIVIPDEASDVMQKIIALVANVTGIKNTERITRRIDPQKMGIPPEELHRALMCGSKDVWDRVHNTITINETYFFRVDLRQVWEKNILPYIVEKTKTGKLVKIWSAATSTGQEAYSLVMLADKAGLSSRVSLLGTDISSKVIAHARVGKYDSFDMARTDLSAEMIYFDQAQGKDLNKTEKGVFQIKPKIKQQTRFEVMNLKEINPQILGGKQDVIVCRNVFFYFNKEDAIQIIQAMFDYLEDGGFFVVTATEEMYVRDAGIKYESLGNGVFRKKSRIPF